MLGVLPVYKAREVTVIGVQRVTITVIGVQRVTITVTSVQRVTTTHIVLVLLQSPRAALHKIAPSLFQFRFL